MSDGVLANIKFVQAVKRYPSLYNYYLPEYSRRDITEKAWAEIAKEAQCTVSMAKERWKNLRSVYVRKRKSSLSGSRKKGEKPYYLNRYMGFIRPFIKTQVTELSNVPSSPSTEIDIKSEFPVECEENSVTETITSHITTATDESSAPKRKNEEFNVDETFEYVEAEKNKNESFETLSNPRRQFVESLLPELHEMPEHTFRLFKRKVLELIDNLNTISQTSLQPQYSNSSSFASAHVSSPEVICPLPGSHHIPTRVNNLSNDTDILYNP